MARLIAAGKAIRLESSSPLLRRKEWSPWKKRGYRVADKDGRTIWHEKEAIRLVVEKALSPYDADVFLFGSRTKGDASSVSDYDVGYWADPPVPGARIATLREELESLPIPAKVDLVDFRHVPVEFRELVIKEGKAEIWKQRSKSSIFT